MRILGACIYTFVLLGLTSPALGKRVELINGDLSLDVPAELAAAAPPRRSTELRDRYEVPAYFRSRDRRVSVEITYGKQDLDPRQLPAFLQYKVAEYSNLERKVPRFRWLSHKLVTRGGRECADISFAHGHGNTPKTEAYARCLSYIVNRRLLEIWVVTHRMPSARDKSLVDGIISSVGIARRRP